MKSVSRHSIRYLVGSIFREAGEAMDRMGCFLQGSMAYKEELNRTRRVMGFLGNNPTIQSTDVFIAPNASVIGKVTIGPKSSIWYNTVVRGDVNTIKIGENTNIQDRVVIHCTGKSGHEKPTIIGNNVTVESGAILHACTLEDECYVGMGATVLDGAVVGKGAMIAPGSVVTPGTTVPSGEIWAGVPAKKLRELTPEEQASIMKSATENAELAQVHKEETDKEFETLLRDMEKFKFREDRLQDYTYEKVEDSQQSGPVKAL
ncbi:hypothetical protein FDP41_006532 [Naegleria fowleri]|uniref:Gamma carbonic anhydrase n=1 Tax=Naegleria fowleri TaxID=5763 RepID=A0A6A5BKG4_NAEFO|nr:uncharacterized protein FDP41_006532 [Naegleria fowleri]KAF0974500.1 hypothetical protein FDP41_006532 [Naegleria fowleri]